MEKQRSVFVLRYAIEGACTLSSENWHHQAPSLGNNTQHQATIALNCICERLSIPYLSLFRVSVRPKTLVHQKSVGLFSGSWNTIKQFFPHKLMVLCFMHFWLTKVFIGMLYFWLGDAVITKLNQEPRNQMDH